MSDDSFVPEDLERTAGLPFTDDSADPPLRLDLYRMRDASFRGPRPAVLWLHGGGWMSGDKERGVERIFGLVRRGFIGASADYRLSMDAQFPAQIHDVKCAIRFLRAHAARFSIDPARIGAWGASAGGHLVSLLATSTGIASLEGARGWADQDSGIQAACSWFGPSNLNLMNRFPPGISPRMESMTASSAEGRLVGGPVEQRQDAVSLADPLRYVRAGCPPILLMHGAKDDCVPLACSEEFYRRLLATGIPAALHVIPDGQHNAYLWGPHHLELVREFFDWHLRSR